MPVLISLKFDKGYDDFNIALQKELDGLKDFRGLFRAIIDWFEGNSELMGEGSPIVDIYESAGSLLGANWTNSAKYEEWKTANWQELRVVGLPITDKAEQILSGHTLGALLSSKHPNAVREFTDKSMVYGVENEYSDRQQEKKHILDVNDKMNAGLERLIARWVKTLSPGLEIQE